MTKRALLKDQKVFFNYLDEDSAKNDRQLDSLFDSSKSQSVMWIKLESIQPNPHQPRTNFDQDKLEELAESIRKKGLLQAITVRQKENVFEIIAGERRYRACKLLGMREIPAMVRNDVDDLGTLEIALIENLQREDLTALEEARIYFRMLQELNYTQDQLSRTLSKSQQYINDRLQLLHLSPAVQESIQENRLSLSKARKIATIKDRDLQEKVSEKVLRDGLNARQTEQLVKSTKQTTPEHKPKKKVNMVLRFALLKSAICTLLNPEEIKQLSQNDKRKLIKMLQEFVTELGDVCSEL